MLMTCNDNLEASDIDANKVISAYMDLLERHRLFAVCAQIRTARADLRAQTLVSCDIS